MNNEKNNVRKTVSYAAPLQYCQREKEQNKLLISSSTNASTKPFTMMIELVYTIAAEVTMKRSFWPIDIASVAVLQSCYVVASSTYHDIERSFSSGLGYLRHASCS